MESISVVRSSVPLPLEWSVFGRREVLNYWSARMCWKWPNFSICLEINVQNPRCLKTVDVFLHHDVLVNGETTGNRRYNCRSPYTSCSQITPTSRVYIISQTRQYCTWPNPESRILHLRFPLALWKTVSGFHFQLPYEAHSSVWTTEHHRLFHLLYRNVCGEDGVYCRKVVYGLLLERLGRCRWSGSTVRDDLFKSCCLLRGVHVYIWDGNEVLEEWKRWF